MKIAAAAVLASCLIAWNFLGQVAQGPRRRPKPDESRAVIVVPKLHYRQGDCFEPPERATARAAQLRRIAARAEMLDGACEARIPKSEMFVTVVGGSDRILETLRSDPEVEAAFKVCQFGK